MMVTGKSCMGRINRTPTSITHEKWMTSMIIYKVFVLFLLHLCLFWFNTDQLLIMGKNLYKLIDFCVTNVSFYTNVTMLIEINKIFIYQM